MIPLRPALAGLLAGLLAVPLLRAQNAEPTPTVITSTDLDMRSTDFETTSIFTGNVVVTGTNLRITCDRLVVIAVRGGDPQAAVGKFERFKSLLATGRVTIAQGQRTATAGRAEVLPGEDKITLTESPLLTDEDTKTTFTGDPIILHRGERHVTGRNIRIVAPELKDLGVDKGKRDPATPPAPPAEPKP